jgi:hypothetical protein
VKEKKDPLKEEGMIFEHSKDETPCFTFETAN